MSGKMQNEKAAEQLDRLAVKPARAAILLDCSRTKLYDAINRGEIRAVRVAGMLRIPMSEIRRRLECGDEGMHDRRAD